MDKITMNYVCIFWWIFLTQIFFPKNGLPCKNGIIYMTLNGSNLSD